MSYFDYSHLGLGPGGGSYSSGLDKIGDALTEVMRLRAKQRDDDAKLAQHQADQKRLADQAAAEQQIQRDQLAQAQKNQDAQREFERTKLTSEVLPKALEAFRSEGPEAASAIGAGAGINFQPRPIDLPAAPVAPQRPEPVTEGPIDIGNEGAPTSPPPQNPNSLDMHEYEQKVAAFRAEQQRRGDEAYAARDKQAADVAAFPQRQQEFERDQAAYPQKLQDAQRGQQYDIQLPGGRSGGTVSRAGLVEGPRQQAANEFRTAQLALITPQEEQAKALMNAGGPPEVAARRRAAGQQMLADAQEKRGHVERIAASIASGVEQPKEAGKALESTLAEGRKRAATEEDKATYNLTAAKQEELRRLQIAATAAAGNANRGVRQQDADTKQINAYQGMVREAKTAALQKVDVTEMKNLDHLNENLQKPNGPQTQLLIDGMVKGAIGGRAAVQLVQNVRNSLGPVVAAQIPVYQALHNGQYPPKVVEAYRKIAADMASVSKKQRLNTFQAISHKVGHGSRWAQDPAMAPYVDDEMRAAADELGLTEQDLAPPKKPGAPAAAPRQPAPARHPAASAADDFLDSLQ